jgi:hypothetical protein
LIWLLLSYSGPTIQETSSRIRRASATATAIAERCAGEFRGTVANLRAAKMEALEVTATCEARPHSEDSTGSLFICLYWRYSIRVG